MKIPLVSAFLEDDVYETRLNDKFMKEVICNEDHFYHRIAKSLSGKNFEPIVYYMSQEKNGSKDSETKPPVQQSGQPSESQKQGEEQTSDTPPEKKPDSKSTSEPQFDPSEDLFIFGTF